MIVWEQVGFGKAKTYVAPLCGEQESCAQNGKQKNNTIAEDKSRHAFPKTCVNPFYHSNYMFINCLDSHDFFFFNLIFIVDKGNKFISSFLNINFSIFEFIFREFYFFEFCI